MRDKNRLLAIAAAVSGAGIIVGLGCCAFENQFGNESGVAALAGLALFLLSLCGLILTGAVAIIGAIVRGLRRK